MRNPALFVRAVRPTDKAHVTTTRVHAEQAGWQVLDRPALDHHGRPLPPTPHVELGATPQRRRKPRTNPQRRRKPRTNPGAVIPEPEAPVSADTEETA